MKKAATVTEPQSRITEISLMPEGPDRDGAVTDLFNQYSRNGEDNWMDTVARILIVAAGYGKDELHFYENQWHRSLRDAWRHRLTRRPMMKTLPDKTFLQACVDGDANVYMHDDYEALWDKLDAETREPLFRYLGFDANELGFVTCRKPERTQEVINRCRMGYAFSSAWTDEHVLPLQQEIERRKDLLYSGCADDNQVDVQLAAIGNLLELKSIESGCPEDLTYFRLESDYCRSFCGFVGDVAGVWDADNRPLLFGDTVDFEVSGEMHRATLYFHNGGPNMGQEMLLMTGAKYVGPFSGTVLHAPKPLWGRTMTHRSAVDFLHAFRKEQGYAFKSRTQIRVTIGDGGVSVFCNDGLAVASVMDYNEYGSPHLSLQERYEWEAHEQITNRDIQRYGMRVVN